MTTIVFTYADGSKKILKSKSKEVRNYIKDLVSDFGAISAVIK